MGIPGSSPSPRPPAHPTEGKLAGLFATSARRTASPSAGGGPGGCERSCPRCAPRPGRPIAPLSARGWVGAAVTRGSPWRPPRLRVADVVPPARPRDSRGQPASPRPARGLFQGGQPPPPRPPALAEGSPEQRGRRRQTGAPPQAGGPIRGGKRPSSLPLLPQARVAQPGIPPRTAGSRRSLREPGRRARGGSGSRSAPPPHRPAAKGVVSLPAWLRGGVGAVSSPIYQLPSGVRVQKEWERWVTDVPLRGEPTGAVSRGRCQHRQQRPGAAHPACHGEPAAPLPGLPEAPPRAAPFPSITGVDGMEKPAVWIGKSTALEKGDPTKCV